MTEDEGWSLRDDDTVDEIVRRSGYGDARRRIFDWLVANRYQPETDDR